MDEKIRFRRLFERSRSDDPINFSELKERDKRELEFGLDLVLEEANYNIMNNSSIEELKEKTKEVILKIIKNY